MSYTKEQAAGLRKRLSEGFDDIPTHMHDGVKAYVDSGRTPGGFLYAVLSNDFCGALAHADGSNLRRLRAWMLLLQWHMPPGSWGSSDKVDAWIKNKGLSGQTEAEVQA